ncbi:MAG: MoaD/ThiS family protein [Pseudomonadales bacterium]|nr:MoaD/ThiS family protein [Pseudomonadales bacterium]
MLQVDLSFDLQQFCGGLESLKVQATNIRELLEQLDIRFPGLGAKIEKEMAVTINGVIYQDTLIEPIEDGSEIYFIPKIGGG